MDVVKTEKSIFPLLASMTRGDYDAAIASVARSRLTSSDMREVLDEYPFKLIRHDVPLESLFDVVSIGAASKPSWSVNLPLWTAEEGRSDLTLQLTVVDSGREFYEIELDDLHVL